jgi:hypothetical protein
MSGPRWGPFSSRALSHVSLVFPQPAQAAGSEFLEVDPAFLQRSQVNRRELAARGVRGFVM